MQRSLVNEPRTRGRRFKIAFIHFWIFRERTENCHCYDLTKEL
jgi:hypothetical protein